MSKESDESLRVRTAYARYAENARKRRSWSSANAGNASIRFELVEAVFALAGPALLAAEQCLDVGCGTGWWLEQLAAHPEVHANLHGLDVLTERIDAARERVPLAELVTGDARGLPYADGSFDLVSLFTVLSSLSGRTESELVLGEASRVLKPGGVLLVWEPRLPNPLNRGTVLIRRRSLERALRGATIEVRSTTLLPPLARRLGRHADRLYPLLSSLPALRTHRLMCARVQR